MGEGPLTGAAPVFTSSTPASATAPPSSVTAPGTSPSSAQAIRMARTGDTYRNDEVTLAPTRAMANVHVM